MSICPRCNITLEEADYREEPIAACARCRGQWVTSDSLWNIVEAWNPAPDTVEPVGGAEHQHVALADVREELPCPNCGRIMETFNYAADSNIILDRCADCNAVWLDGGEMEKVGWWGAMSRRGLAKDVKRFSADLHHEEVRQDALEQQDIRTSPFPAGSSVASPFIEGTEGP